MKRKENCRLYSAKQLKGLLAAGLVLAALGVAAGYLLPEEEHLATRIAGFVSGVGSSLAMIGAVLLLRRWRLGEARAKDAELAMTDERGMAVAYKAQSVAAIAAVLALVGVCLGALIRGDDFYVLVCSALLIAVALVKLAAWHFYNKTM